MNVFVVDTDPDVAARQLCDKHVIKMTLETAQILSTVARSRGIDAGYKATHKAHPCVLWAAQSPAHWTWLVKHGFALASEYRRRYGKDHASERVIELIAAHLGMTDERPSTFVQCMPDQYQDADPVVAYRRYYMTEKAAIATWRDPSTRPDWFVS